MSYSQDKKTAVVTVSSRQRSSSDDSSSNGSSAKAPSLKSPRTPRFAEATAVHSPIEPSQNSRLPFADSNRSSHYMAQPQVSDVGFGYVNRHESVEMPDTDNNDFPSTTPARPLKSPLKSAMKTPGAPPRELPNLMSPTFREEELVEKAELHTSKRQKRDVLIQARVRLSKVFLRGVNFSCSLIVLAMLASSFNIFNATKSLPPRSGFTPWAPAQKIWPQLVLLVVACVSLATAMLVMWGYRRGDGKTHSEKARIWYFLFATAWFWFSIVMWLLGAGVLQHAKNSSDDKDMWGWSCADNTRKILYQNDVSYDLVCRMMSWSLVCCVIEVVVEFTTIAIYGFVIWRFYSQRTLRKSMATRDRARSDLYAAQLRNETVPPTPGFNIPYSAHEEGIHHQPTTPAVDAFGSSVQYVHADQKHKPAPFILQAPPQKGATPRVEQTGFSPVAAPPRNPSPAPPPAPPTTDLRSPLLSSQATDFPPESFGPQETQQDHFGAAPGERVYAPVPVPGAYDDATLPADNAALSPAAMNFPPPPQQHGYFPR